MLYGQLSPIPACNWILRNQSGIDHYRYQASTAHVGTATLLHAQVTQQNLLHGHQLMCLHAQFST